MQQEYRTQRRPAGSMTQVTKASTAQEQGMQRRCHHQEESMWVALPCQTILPAAGLSVRTAKSESQVCRAVSDQRSYHQTRQAARTRKGWYRRWRLNQALQVRREMETEMQKA